MALEGYAGLHNISDDRFNVDKLTFMGHVLSAKGINPEKFIVKAITNARNPEMTLK